MSGVTTIVPMACGGPARREPDSETQRGFTMTELVVVMGAVGAILTPILGAVDASMDTIRVEQSEVTMQTAREALIRHAARNDGCLPFAADWEGGLPNTDQTGAPGYTDTGVAKDNARAGDLPWADLGLSEGFGDGGGLRIQYSVASQYADAGSGCAARAMGAEWNQMVTYQGPPTDILYVNYTPPGGSRGLYEIDGTLVAGTRPDASFADVGDPLPSSLLELRRGPDVKAPGSEKDVLSAQNVFLLLATGDNINTIASINLPYMRDANHRGNSGGGPWNLNQNVIDGVVFSATRAFDGSDEGKDGDDILMAVSFLSFKADLRKFGVRLEPVCQTRADSIYAGSYPAAAK